MFLWQCQHWHAVNVDNWRGRSQCSRLGTSTTKTQLNASLYSLRTTITQTFIVYILLFLTRPESINWPKREKLYIIQRLYIYIARHMYVRIGLWYYDGWSKGLFMLSINYSALLYLYLFIYKIINYSVLAQGNLMHFIVRSTRYCMWIINCEFIN